MKKQNLMAGMCLSLATAFVAFVSLLFPLMYTLGDGMGMDGSMEPKTILYLVGYGCLAIFGIVYTIMSIISICKLGKDDAVVAKKKGLFIATIVFQFILVAAGIIATLGGISTLKGMIGTSATPDTIIQIVIMYGTPFIALMAALLVNVVAFIVNVVSVCKLKKAPVVEKAQ